MKREFNVNTIGCQGKPTQTASEKTQPSYHKDPVNDFLDCLHRKENIKDTRVIETNKTLLTSLIKKNYISQSSIIWDKNSISKIHGISFDNNQYIQFCKPKNKKNYTEKTVSFGNNIEDEDVDSIKKAFLRAKQTKLWQREVQSCQNGM